MRLSGIDLACVRGGRLVFKDLSFSIANGEILAVRGPNGTGKSSLLRLIAG
jgi:heme exporter protein A